MRTLERAKTHPSSKLRLLLTVVVTAAVALSLARGARAAPAPLSAGGPSPSIASSYRSGSFGRWQVDSFGLPVYLYTADEQTDPKAGQPELDGATRAQHELGNDHIKGMAYNDGYTELWSQDLLAQWANRFQPQSRHYAGGYGYLNVAGRAISTLYLDRPGIPARARVRRRLLPPGAANRSCHGRRPVSACGCRTSASRRRPS